MTGFGLGALESLAIANECIESVDAAIDEGANLQGADTWGLINGEHPSSSMPIYLPGSENSTGRWTQQMPSGGTSIALRPVMPGWFRGKHPRGASA